MSKIPIPAHDRGNNTMAAGKDLPVSQTVPLSYEDRDRLEQAASTYGVGAGLLARVLLREGLVRLTESDSRTKELVEQEAKAEAERRPAAGKRAMNIRYLGQRLEAAIDAEQEIVEAKDARSADALARKKKLQKLLDAEKARFEIYGPLKGAERAAQMKRFAVERADAADRWAELVAAREAATGEGGA